MIRRLPRAVVDRIAAGEVVERPASVVKELVENALDAGARDITVAIEGGGLDLIRVADDGRGMGADELPLAVAAHATSKLVDVDDLLHIVSFGFRGEALSSISAVSRFRITTSSTEDGAGFRLTADGGVVSEPRPTPSPRGTVVEVRDLFFNTPARRRFLGAKSTEAARCREVCTSLALVNAGVRFRFEQDGKARFASDGAGELVDRVTAVYGAEFAEQLVPVASRVEGMELSGLLTLPGAARHRPRAKQLFVNGRAVRDTGVVSAVRVACKDFVPPSLQASWVLCLTMDPQDVDVNVHPTKAEVRFRDRDAVFRLVRRACRDALVRSDLAPRVRAEHVFGGAVSESPPAAGTPSMSFPAAPPAPGTPASSRAGGATQPAREGGPDAAGEEAGRSTGDVALDPAVAATPGELLGTSSAPTSGAGQLAMGDVRPAARFLQILDTYIVHDSPEGLVILDQHALHERVLYARLQKDLAEGRVARQQLLVPETVRLEPLELERALAMADELARMALEIEAFGTDTVVVRSIPAVLRSERIEDLLRALIDREDVHGGIPHGLDRRLFTMACHAAVKAGDPLDEAEIAELLRQSAALEHDATCPHGRPTRLLVGATELERLFKRSGF